MRTIILLILFVLSPQLLANDGLYMQVGLGFSKPIINPEYRPEGANESDDNYAFQLSLGYQFKNNIVLEGGYLHHSTIDITGSTDNSFIQENVLLAGYSFDITKHWSIIPRAGYSWWRLESSEGWILNPGDEEQTNTTGHDFTYMLTATYQAFYMTYQGTNFEFGRGRAVIFGANIDF